MTIELTTITDAELCERVQRPGVRIAPGTVRGWLAGWQRLGIVEEIEPGAWTITPRGLVLCQALARAAPESQPAAEAA